MAPSKWLKSIQSSLLSPKAWLAHRIAHVLNEFFVLDTGEQQIESNLLTDTKIVLRNLQVRPQQLLHSNVWLYGSVQETKFSWKWTAKGALVKNTKLSIRGAHFRIVLGGDDEGAQPQKDAEQSPIHNRVDNTRVETSAPTPSDSTTAASWTDPQAREGYIQRQIQQISDHLSVDMEDVELVVEDKTSKTTYTGIVVKAKKFQLVSEKATKEDDKLPPQPPQVGTSNNHNSSRSKTVRNSFSRVIKKARRRSSSTSAAAAAASPPQSSKPPLTSHRISIEGVCASVLLEPLTTTTGRPTKTLPLLDPIGYGIVMSRVAGQRHFLLGGSWETGLSFVGEVLPSAAMGSDGGSLAAARIHAERDQVSTVGRLLMRIISLRDENLSNNAVDATSSNDDSIPTDITSSSSSSSSFSEDTTTTIELPIPATLVTLPYNSTIRTSQCSFGLHADGSVCRFSSGNNSEKGGIWIDQHPLLLFDDEEGSGNGTTKTCSGKWLVDLVARRVSLQQEEPTKTDAVAQIRWNDAVMKQLVREIVVLVSTSADFMPLPKSASQAVLALHHQQSYSKKKCTLAASTSATKWTFDSSGAIQLHVSCRNEWLKVKVVRPSIQVSIDTSNDNPCVTELSVDGIEVGPTSIGKSKSTRFHIPAIQLQDGEEGELWSQGIIVEGGISGVVESQRVLERLVEFGHSIFTSYPDNTPVFLSPTRRNKAGRHMPLYLRIPGANLRIDSVNMDVVAEGIMSRSPFDQVRCRSLAINDSDGFALALAGIKASIRPSLCAKINAIDEFHIPGIVCIENPSKKGSSTTKATYKEDGKVYIEAPELQVRILDGRSTRRYDSTRAKAAAPMVEPIRIPFPIYCVCPWLEVKQTILGGLTTSITRVECHLVPFEASYAAAKAVPFSSSQSVAFQLLVDAAENKLMKLDTTTASGVIETQDFSTIQQFCFATEAAEVRAGPTSVDLKSFFDGDVPAVAAADPIWLPHANIGSVPVHLRWKGPVMGTKRTWATIPAFHGDSKTNSNQVIRFYRKAMVERAAATIADNKILGPKVSKVTAKMTAKTAGAILTGSEKVADNVRGTIASGKKSRNAKPGAKYKFGDFTRGTIHKAINDIKKTEAEIRRSSEVFSEAFARSAFQI